MNRVTGQTAILFFTRTAHEEAQAKPIFGDAHFAQNKLVAKKLIAHTHRQINASDFPFRTVLPEQQKGESFGEKLSNAFQSLFDEGFERVIAIGNDCARLSSQDITAAAEQLRELPVVAGPSVDGGAYLIGLQKSAFHKDRFDALAWRSRHLFDDLLKYANKGGFATHQLPVMADIDDKSALQHFVQCASNKALRRSLASCIRSIIGSISTYHVLRIVSFSVYLKTNLRHRGPPLS